MTPDHEKRNFVAGMYPGHGWKVKVKGMSDAQVFAIYQKEQRKLEEEKKKPKPQDNQDDIPF